MPNSICLECKAGWHGECIEPTKFDAPDQSLSLYSCCCHSNSATAASFSSVTPLDTRRAEKADEDIKDQTSTGRKRAAAMYPITDGMLCEWGGLRYAGGGAVPIIGCASNVIVAAKEPVFENGVTLMWPGAVHHGPDKSTLNNTPQNVHRICVNCHNRWHAMNDRLYGERPPNGGPFLPLSGEMLRHNPEEQATPEELAWSEQYWKTPQKQRESLPYRLEL